MCLMYIIREEGFKMLQNTKSSAVHFFQGLYSKVISKPNKFVFLLRYLLSSEAKILAMKCQLSSKTGIVGVSGMA